MGIRKVVGIGESVLDIVFKGDQPQAAVPGGSTFNAMVSLGRTLGVKSPDIPLVMVTQTGDDYVGDIVASFMKANNLRTEGVSRKAQTHSTVSLAFLNESNDAKYQFLRDKSPLADSFIEIDFHEGDVVVFGSFFAVNPSLRDYTRRQMRNAHSAGAVIYYDINYRKNHQSILSETLPSIEENCAMSDFVRASSEDLMCIYGTDDAAKVYNEKMSSLCKNFICTHGDGPIEVFCPSGHYTYEIIKVDTVVSTIGAGDNFNAGFVYGLVGGAVSKEVVSDMKQENWTPLVEVARKFSSNVCRSIYNYVDKDFVDCL
ncbi:MAG: PfkB family carbohydrate kinase [Bacteroidales bacterium]|nr:PfkB family carbohydrate kinase [Bacteroidales bacterium]